jgi:hypothetical protein
MLGGWLKPETPVKTVCEQSAKVFLDKDFSGFKGDPKFITDPYACKMYSKLRSAIAGVYAWRAARVKEPKEKERMRQAADYAFRQAFALCPYSPEAVFRYVNLLVQDKKFEDSLLITQTALKLQPQNVVLRGLAGRLRSMAKGEAEPAEEEMKN